MKNLVRSYSLCTFSNELLRALWQRRKVLCTVILSNLLPYQHYFPISTPSPQAAVPPLLYADVLFVRFPKYEGNTP